MDENACQNFFKYSVDFHTVKRRHHTAFCSKPFFNGFSMDAVFFHISSIKDRKSLLEAV